DHHHDRLSDCVGADVHPDRHVAATDTVYRQYHLLHHGRGGSVEGTVVSLSVCGAAGAVNCSKTHASDKKPRRTAWYGGGFYFRGARRWRRVGATHRRGDSTGGGARILRPRLADSAP